MGNNVNVTPPSQDERTLSRYEINIPPDSFLYKQRSVNVEQDTTDPCYKTAPVEYNEPFITQTVPQIEHENEAKDLITDDIGVSETVSAKNPHFEDRFSSLTVPNTDSSLEFHYNVEQVDYKSFSEDVRSASYERSLVLEKAIVTAGRVYDNYLSARTIECVLPLRVDITNDPVYQNTKDEQLKSDLENCRECKNPRKLLKKYLAEYEALCEDDVLPYPLNDKKALYEYRALVMMTSFPSYKEKYTITAQPELELIDSSSNYAPEFPAKLDKSFDMPRHTAYLQVLEEMFPNTEFKVSYKNIPAHSFPTYMIEFHLDDESLGGRGRDIRIQVSDQEEGICYLDNGLSTSKIPSADKLSRLRMHLNRGISPITKEMKEEYCDVMLSFAVVEGDMAAVQKFLRLGADPNRVRTVSNGQVMITEMFKTLEEAGLLPYRPGNVFNFRDDCGLLLKTSLENFGITKTRMSYMPNKGDLLFEPAIFTACSSFMALDEDNSIEKGEPDPAIVEELINAGADINMSHHVHRYDRNILGGINCLLIAMNEVNYDMTEFLVNHGANLSIGYRIKGEKHPVKPLDYAKNVDAQRAEKVLTPYERNKPAPTDIYSREYRRYFPLSGIIARKEAELAKGKKQ